MGARAAPEGDEGRSHTGFGRSGSIVHATCTDHPVTIADRLGEGRDEVIAYPLEDEFVPRA